MNCYKTNSILREFKTPKQRFWVIPKVVAVVNRIASAELTTRGCRVDSLNNHVSGCVKTQSWINRTESPKHKSNPRGSKSKQGVPKLVKKIMMQHRMRIPRYTKRTYMRIEIELWFWEASTGFLQTLREVSSLIGCGRGIYRIMGDSILSQLEERSPGNVSITGGPRESGLWFVGRWTVTRTLRVTRLMNLRSAVWS